MTEPTVTPLAQTIELRVTGQPDVPNQYGSGHIRPTEITFRYQTGSIRVQVYGRWIREDGELTDAPITRDYTAYQGDMSDWPDWVAELAREHAPAVMQPTTGETLATQPDTLPAWLHWRFGPHGQPWSEVPDEDKSLWEHQARAVRRAVARGGFKQPASQAAGGAT